MPITDRPQSLKSPLYIGMVAAGIYLVIMGFLSAFIFSLLRYQWPITETDVAKFMGIASVILISLINIAAILHVKNYNYPQRIKNQEISTATTSFLIIVMFVCLVVYIAVQPEEFNSNGNGYLTLLKCFALIFAVYLPVFAFALWQEKKAR